MILTKNKVSFWKLNSGKDGQQRQLIGKSIDVLQYNGHDADSNSMSNFC